MTNEMKRQNCIFTSAGNRHNVKQWVSDENRSWDLITVYYGQDSAISSQLQNISDVFVDRKGSKFQNLHALFTSNPKLFEGYEYIWVMDDDLVISPDQIEEMFKIAKKWDLWVCQPAFDLAGKISHEITGFNPVSILRIVDFVEVTCPLFNSQKLNQFLCEYDGSLVGWGIDYWFSYVLQSKTSNKFAVVDTVKIYNPTDEDKDGVREIDILQPTPARSQHSNEVLSRLNITTDIPKNIAWLIPDSTVRQISFKISKLGTETKDRYAILRFRSWRITIFLRKINFILCRFVRGCFSNFK